jgi:hypothetical protein
MRLKSHSPSRSIGSLCCTFGVSSISVCFTRCLLLISALVSHSPFLPYISTFGSLIRTHLSRFPLVRRVGRSSGACWTCPLGSSGRPTMSGLRNLVQSASLRISLAWLTNVCCKDTDILHFPVIGTNIIVLDSAEAVLDLMEKRSSKYSDRHVVDNLNVLSLSITDFCCFLYMHLL